MPLAGRVIDLCSGPGGWDIAACSLGMDPVGFELDPVACATRRAAGLRTVQADVNDLQPPSELHGLIGSPPCTVFSISGDQAGTRIVTEITALIRDEFTGIAAATRSRRQAQMMTVLRDAGWPYRDMTVDARTAAIREAVQSASLMAVPARFIHASHPEWVALEQVPAVLPMFRVYAAEMRRGGYSAWCGVINAADYGLGQIRRRAVLIASRCRAVHQPPPTHYDPSRGTRMWGTPRTSMAEVLGWGATHRPSPTVTAGGIKSGGPEPFGNAARQQLARERDAGRWKPRDGTDSLRPTAAECAALQGFPPRYPFAGGAGKQIQQAGNAVPPPLARAVLSIATGTRLGEVAS